MLSNKAEPTARFPREILPAPMSAYPLTSPASDLRLPMQKSNLSALLSEAQTVKKKKKKKFFQATFHLKGKLFLKVWPLN